MQQPVCFCDSAWYALDDYPEMEDAFSGYPEIFQVSNHRFQFKVTGLLSTQTTPVVVFPKNYCLPEDRDAVIAEARVLARVLLRYRNEPYHQIDELKLLYGSDTLSSSRIAAAIQLLEDYCREGLLRRNRMISGINQAGRTDWSATIHKTIPIAQHSSVLYPEPITRRSIRDDHNLLYRIHRFVIAECFQEWGWLLGYDDFSGDAGQPFDVREAINFLQKELRATYIERELGVVKLLIQYLEGMTGSAVRKLDVLATAYFSFVWEAICGYLMDNQYPKLKSLLPQPVWEGQLHAGAISQRPDIFRVANSRLYILDAKYYDFNDHLPGWQDVVKQLFYRHTMQAVWGTKRRVQLLPGAQEICNAFLFPGNKHDFQYIGKVHVPQAADLGEIRAFALNQSLAFRAYAGQGYEPFKEGICTTLQESF